MTKTYTILVRLTVRDTSDEYLHTVRSTRDEIRSWLEDLDATVHSVKVEVEQRGAVKR